MSTPLRSRHSSSNLAGTPTRAGGGLGRVPGTPLGRVLAAEGLAVRSPRKIRHKSLPDKAKDWVSNRFLSLETSIQDLSFDQAGYPLAIGFNSLHFLIRLPHFYSALPPISTLWSSREVAAASRYARQAAQMDADARFAALKTGSANASSWYGGGWLGWSLSVVLVLISVGNAVYLASRRRKYQLMLRKDPLSSPNAKSATLRFSPQAPPKKPLLAQAKDFILTKIGFSPTEVAEEPHSFPIQELYVWTPEYVLWSLRLFTGYPPPIALMYHFLAPSTFIPFLIIGPSLLFLIFSLVHLYSTLLKDRQILSTETMHEYNSTFVYPKVFRQKRDVGVSTEELEFIDWKKEKIYSSSDGGAGGVGRESMGATPEGNRTSTTPSRRRRRHTEMLG
ncbi:Nur1/Mug154 family protein [Sporobolomyces salmoneus]|uniref:Nur1/Mug154 family protein n=1 Tax=Sporobolomyces salmoneus TaxID=183962 RepID=UPI00317A159B